MAVGLLGLVGCLQPSQARQFVGGNQSAFDTKGSVNELGGGACHGVGALGLGAVKPGMKVI